MFRKHKNYDIVGGMVRTLNIKVGQPKAEDALTKMRAGLALAHRDGVELVRLVHGYGSGGAGGVLCTKCRACLEQLVAGGRVLRYVRGDDYSHGRAAALEWLRKYPELRKTIQSDSYNPGITFVALCTSGRGRAGQKTGAPGNGIPVGGRAGQETGAPGTGAPGNGALRATKKGNPPSPRTTPPQKRTGFTRTGKGFDVLKNVVLR